MAQPDAGLVEAEDLSFGYARDALLLNGWSARFETGTMTALTGPSGRGKSTLMYLLGLMLRPTSGRVWVEGVDTATLTDAELAGLRARRFGFVFQDAALDMTRSVLDNVTETTLYRGTRREDAADRARDLLDRFGVNLPVDRKPGQVSGGQAQRIALCRALLNRPHILLADEPTGNLDPASATVVVQGLREQADSGAAVIIVTHSPDVAASCDREIRL
ncbi:ATP-binding cassette domain-containing protein [Microbacterium resistens]|uniref:ABC transporter ATP-binding protein n=1 Tax=Microbacterium resistens TaxID=156977 RepID=UPI001C56ACA3|nr:ATP-binding cassette domain-containing protein [Microbacterium resistens]MBW1637819.1 ATP-binding cassette domain-containing protein [Microbacterium resistens]